MFRRLLFPAVLALAAAAASSSIYAFHPVSTTSTARTKVNAADTFGNISSRRDWLMTGAVVGAGLASAGVATPPRSAQAVGPVKINLLNPKYTAKPCPKDKPIPGEKAMKGMKGLCVTVDADLEEPPEKPLELVGVYGFVTDKESGESVLANNPDLSTDAGAYGCLASYLVSVTPLPAFRSSNHCFLCLFPIF